MPPDSQPWEIYRVGTPSTQENWTNDNCKPFTWISHVTHIDLSLSIIRRNSIRPQLVYDESILNDDRILVNWLSPNGWADGSRYGNVQFRFPFQDLISGSRYYWVESINRYRIPALRILITDKDRSSHPMLREYDPRLHKGPWWYDEASGNHYRNGNYTLEFMIEKEIRASDADSIDFVDHHKKYCCLDYACTESGMGARVASGIFGAGAVTHNQNCSALPISEDAVGHLRQELLAYYWRAAKRTAFKGKDTSQTTEDALAQAWVSAWYFRRTQQQLAIESMFSSLESFFDAVIRLFEPLFGADRLAIKPQPAQNSY